MSSRRFVQTFFFPAALTGVIFFNACTSSEKKSDEGADTTAVQADTTAAVAQDTTDVIADFPPVSEVPSLLQLSGADFNQSLLNDAGKAKNYTTTADKAALNLGVYATDIGYLSVYGKTQPAITHIRSAQTLSDYIGINNAYGTAMQKRFEQNISNKDSLVKIVDEGMHSANRFLKENNRQGTSALALTGGFIEGLYISTGLIEKYPKSVPENVRNQVLVSLIRTILKQKKTVADLVTLLKNSGQEGQVAEYTASMEELYKRFEAVDFEKMISENKGDLILTDKTLAGITEQVKQMRAKIVS
jgi:hypothetical protein